MLEPIIKNQIIGDYSAQLLLNFPENAEYFDGHFDEFTILPGVIQIHFAMFYGQKYFNINPIITNIKKLKFVNIIKANQNITLKLEYIKDSHKIDFKYLYNDKIYSMGNIIIKD